MTRVVAIVEGDGEVAALPVLLRRIGEWRTPEVYTEVLPPIRVRKDRFLNKPEEFHRHLQLAAAKCGEAGWILILLDADDDCPAAKGAEILSRAAASVPHRPVSVVLANREYEAWFIAAAASLHDCRGFTYSPADAQTHAEMPRDAKGWLAARMAARTYREVSDQPALSAVMDLPLAWTHSRSFRKLCSDWSTHTQNQTAP